MTSSFVGSRSNSSFISFTMHFTKRFIHCMTCGSDIRVCWTKDAADLPSVSISKAAKIFKSVEAPSLFAASLFCKKKESPSITVSCTVSYTLRGILYVFLNSLSLKTGTPS